MDAWLIFEIIYGIISFIINTIIIVVIINRFKSGDYGK
jgi:hypothetical protein